MCERVCWIFVEILDFHKIVKCAKTQIAYLYFLICLNVTWIFRVVSSGNQYAPILLRQQLPHSDSFKIYMSGRIEERIENVISIKSKLRKVTQNRECYIHQIIIKTVSEMQVAPRILHIIYKIKNEKSVKNVTQKNVGNIAIICNKLPYFVKVPH